MANKTSIEWTDYNWNFLRGCSRVSEGCRICYAEGVAARFSGPGMPYDGLAKFVDHKPRWTGEISFHEDILLQPLRWTKPRKVFVNSMSDLFHEKVTDEMLDKAFAVMALTPQHTYQILTKRPERMKAYLDNCNWEPRVYDAVASIARRMHWKRWPDDGQFINRIEPLLFLPNVWLGVSVEDQKTADERIPLLLDVPAALRWISAEPLLGPVDLSSNYRSTVSPIHSHPPIKHKYLDRLDWVVVGGESGPNARPCDLRWIHDIVKQCSDSDVPVFVKQLGAVPMELEAEWRGRRFSRLLNSRNDKRVPADYVPLFYADRKGGNIEQWPDDLKVREFPKSEKTLPAHAL